MNSLHLRRCIIDASCNLRNTVALNANLAVDQILSCLIQPFFLSLLGQKFLPS